VIAVLYAIVYVFSLVAGLPLGLALFGRRHPAAWIAGGVIGYALTAFAIWIPIELGRPSGVAFALAWLAVAWAVLLAAKRVPPPLIVLPEWTRRDGRALLCVLLLTLAIAIPPFARAGAADASGNRYYRAYFTADFVWHEALTVELAKFASPPRNPYLAHRPIHYYWTYFLLPAAATATLPGGREHVETFLKVNAVGTALLFVSAIFLFAWTVVPRAWPVACGVAMAILSSSAEGAYALWRFWQRGVPLGEVRNLNIDALSNWWPPGGLRIDGLQRCFWWVPQHSMAYALGLIALAVTTGGGSGAPITAIVIAGLALAGAAMMNPFVGGVFSLVWGLTVVVDAARSGDFVRRVLRHAIAVVPVALAILWCVGNQMVEGAGGALQFGWLGEARNGPVWTLLLSLGPVLVASLVGVLASLPPKGGSHESSESARNLRGFRLQAEVTAPVILTAVSLLLMYFVRLDVDRAWVGFRAGQIFLAAAPALIACGLSAAGTWRRVSIAVAIVAAAIGAPTTIIDTYNAQDITNFAQSPNGPWTVTVTAEEQQGLDWLRRETPADAIVQMDPLARERSTWSLIPSLAQRRMAAGRPISLLGGTQNDSEYGERSARVKTMYATPDAQAAWDIARALRIDYIWIDRTERTAYPSGMAKFDAGAGRFAPAFRNNEVSIYRVR
jgi:hypothetical protein